MKIVVCNRNEIEKIKLEDRIAIISISTPGSSLPKFSFVPICVLYLYFDDVVNPIPQKIDDKRYTIPFNSSHANKILKFIEKNLKKFDILLIHCDAGVSRSPGVAVALNEIYNGDKEIPSRFSLYNRLVYKRLIEAWRKINELPKPIS